MTLQLDSPIWLALLALLPLWWIWLRPPSDVGFVIAFAEDEQGPAARPSRFTILDVLPTALRTLAVASLTLALAQPQLVAPLPGPSIDNARAVR